MSTPRIMSRTFFVVLRKDRRSYFAPPVIVRVTQAEPTLAVDERAVKITLRIPDTVFEPHSAEVVVDENNLQRPLISAE